MKRTLGKEVDSNVVRVDLGGVNCYLVKVEDGFILIDAGYSAKRKLLLNSLEEAGCKPGSLKFVLITHGDSDHAGNGAFLQREFHAPLGMHPDDFGMVERGDMSWNRKPRADKMSLIMKMVGFFVRLAAKQQFETFTPDVVVGDGFDLAKYGFDAKVIHVPGHSKGSIGVLTANGSFYCGDFLYTTPGMTFVDDALARSKSLGRLEKLDIRTILPGHGKPTRVLR
jgi:hydroxyacylglutathione hydrolase